MSAEFDVKMTQKTMFRFMMYHTYHSFSGWFGVAFGVLTLVLAVLAFHGGTSYMAMLYLFFACYFLLLQPVMLYTRSARQVKMNPVYKEPITYIVNDEGITSRQKDQEAHIGWDQIVKAVRTKSSVLLYTGKRYSVVFPNESMKEQAGAVEACIRKHLDAKQVKL